MKLTEKIDHNEVQRYVDGRYVSAPDAAWKIFRYEMQEKSHTIVQLPVHLKGQENFYFEEHWSEEEIKEAMDKKKMLQGYFDLNNPSSDNYDRDAAELLYYEIPEKYIWQTKTGKWVKRKNNINVLGRMWYVIQ
jgi:hypothetical protein